MAEWTPKVGDLCMVEMPYSGKTHLAGEIVVVDRRLSTGRNGYIDVTILRNGQHIEHWAAFRFCKLPNPKP